MMIEKMKHHRYTKKVFVYKNQSYFNILTTSKVVKTLIYDFFYFHALRFYKISFLCSIIIKYKVIAMYNLNENDKREIAEMTANLVLEKLQCNKPVAEWMSVKDAAQYIGRSESFIRCNKKMFTCRKQGEKNQSRLLLSRTSLDNYINMYAR